MDTVKLEVKTRDLKLKLNALRRSKVIPAIFYGKKEKSIPLQMDYQVFRKAFIKAGSNQVIELHIDGKHNTPVLVHDVQYDPITSTISHVDFLHVNLAEEVTANVPIVIIGSSVAVKDFGGILTTVKHELTVKCLPMDIPHVIEVDVSGLEQLGKSVHISDLPLPKGVKFMDHLEDVIVTVSAPRTEEEAVTPVASGIAGTAAELAAKEDAEKAAAAAVAAGDKGKTEKAEKAPKEEKK